MRPRRWTGLVLAGALYTVPVAAAAACGWKLPLVESPKSDGSVQTSVGWHCGEKRFGTYRLKNGVRTGGDFGYVVYRVKITEDGLPHKPRFLRFGGRLSDELRAQTRDILRRTTYRYVASPTPMIRVDWDNGEMQATRRFDPVLAHFKRKRC